MENNPEIALAWQFIENTGTHQQLLDGDALYRDMWEAHIGAQNWSAGSRKGGN